MSMVCDNHYFYNCTDRHDEIMNACNWHVDFYNFMAGLVIVDETQRQQYEYELTEYLCYDV